MPVFIGSIPNTEEDDVSLAKNILNGTKSVDGSIDELKSKFKDDIFLFNRVGTLFFFLNLLNLNENDEVLTQAFTCVAVVAPILWAKARPVYIDIDPKTFNMDLNLIKEKLSERTRVILVQHTFGNMVDVKKVKEIIDDINSHRDENREIYIVEDCAHLSPYAFSEKNIGKYSDAFFFSFSQDKGISCTQGAMLIFRDPRLLSKATEEYKSVVDLTDTESRYNAKYIVLWDYIKRTYFKKIIPFTDITLGRILIIIFRLLGLIKKQASSDTVTPDTSKKMSEIQACLLLNQFKKAKKLEDHRRKIAKMYNERIKEKARFMSEDSLLRYPILVENRSIVKEKLKERKIIGGIWYSTVVFPLSHNLNTVGYVEGSCPNAEMSGSMVFNLPTNIEVTDEDVDNISNIVNTFAKSA